MPPDRQPNPLGGLRNIFGGPMPVTSSIVLINVVVLILSHILKGAALQAMFSVVMDPSTVLVHPWSLVLYPLIPLDPINLLFAGSAFWLFGGSLERSWGSGRYALLMAVYCVISSLSVLLGDYLLKTDGTLATILMPLAGVIIAFCALNPKESISWWFIPIQTTWVMVITFGMVWYFMGHAVLGLFALAAPFAALAYVRYGRPWADAGTQTRRGRGDIIDFTAARKKKSNARYLDGSLHRAPLDFAGRWRDHQERKKLERLLRNSGLSDPDERRDERKRDR